jgi:hypothetical protein
VQIQLSILRHSAYFSANLFGTDDSYRTLAAPAYSLDAGLTKQARIPPEKTAEKHKARLQLSVNRQLNAIARRSRVSPRMKFNTESKKQTQQVLYELVTTDTISVKANQCAPHCRASWSLFKPSTGVRHGHRRRRRYPAVLDGHAPVRTLARTLRPSSVPSYWSSAHHQKES